MSGGGGRNLSGGGGRNLLLAVAISCTIGGSDDVLCVAVAGGRWLIGGCWGP